MRGQKKITSPTGLKKIKQQANAVRDARNLVEETPSGENNIFLKVASVKI